MPPDVVMVEMGEALLHGVPEARRRGRELLHRGRKLLVCGSRLGESPFEHLAVDVVDRRDGRRWHVDGDEVALEAGGDVVHSTARLRHAGNVREVFAGLPVPSPILLQEGKARLLHRLPNELQGRLVSPVVHEGHGHVIKEDRHPLALRRPEVLAATLLEIRLDGLLVDRRSGGGAEVDLLLHHVVAEAAEEHQDRARLRGSRPADKQRRGALAPAAPQEDRRARRVHGGHEEVREVKHVLLARFQGPSRLRVRPRRRADRRPLSTIADGVLVDREAIRIAWELRRVDGGEMLADPATIVVAFVVEQAAHAPDQGVEEVLLEQAGEVVAEVPALHVAQDADVRARFSRRNLIDFTAEEVVQDRQHALDGADAAVRHDWRAVALQEREEWTGTRRIRMPDELLNQFVEARADLFSLDARPRGRDGEPVEVLFADVDDSRARDRRRTGVDERLHLEHELDVVGHGNTITIGKRQHSIVVQHGVEIFDPDGVNGAVHHDPRVVRVAGIVVFRPDRGEDTGDPFPGEPVHFAIQLLGAHGLRIQAMLAVLLVVDLLQRFLQRLDDLRLARASGADEHDSVPHEGRIVELLDFHHPAAVMHKLQLLDRPLETFLDLGLLGLLLGSGHRGEEI
eukprot:scaffold57_cov254-Pinguiococcus_pyrenoidosus.AAC.43